MSEANPGEKPKEGASAGLPLWLQIVGAVVAIVVSVYSTFIATREKNKADLLTQQIANEKEIPRVDQGRYVFAGDALKSVLSAKKDVAIVGLPNPEVVATDLGKQIIDELKKVTSLKQLQSISVEFIAFTNNGPRPAESLKVMTLGESSLELGDVSVNTTKLLPVSYEQNQPYIRLPRIEPKSIPSSYAFTYSLGGERHEANATIAPRGTMSWIPVVGNMQGIGRALSDEDMEHHLGLPAQP